jgi:hypothetical protein
MGRRVTDKPVSDRGGKIAAIPNKAKLTPLIAYNQPAIVLIAAPKKETATPASTQPVYAGALAWVSNQSVRDLRIFMFLF